jgi:diaminopimelate decarboxylase
MDYFNYRGKDLFAESVSVEEIANRFGTPCYVYSRATLERHWHAFDHAFSSRPHLVCYAVKANSNLAVLNVLAQLGSGFDIVSVGELERVLAAGGDPKKVVFSGVGKREDELQRALEVGIRCFNVEVSEELDRLNDLAGRLGTRAPISLRVNPDIDAGTHPYISTGLKENKFGIEMDAALSEYQRAQKMPHLDIIGVDCHIGSQLTTLSPFTDALDRVLLLVEELKQIGINIHHLDIGGGLGIRYNEETPPEPSDYAKVLFSKLSGTEFEILLEPGRAIVGNAGILVTRIEYLKSTAAKNFVIADAAMNDLIRPALYQSWQEIIPVRKREGLPNRTFDIVGPVCETGDFLGKDRTLDVVQGDLLAVRSSGAYGFCMSSNYNSRGRAAEVMVDGEKAHLVRRRETIQDLFVSEQIPDFQ